MRCRQTAGVSAAGNSYSICQIRPGRNSQAPGGARYRNERGPPGIERAAGEEGGIPESSSGSVTRTSWPCTPTKLSQGRQDMDWSQPTEVVLGMAAALFVAYLMLETLFAVIDRFDR